MNNEQPAPAPWSGRTESPEYEPALRKHAETLAESTMKCIQSVLVKHNMGVIQAANDHAMEQRKRAFDEVLDGLAKMYDKADQPTPMHKGARMALSSASDLVRDLRNLA